ncbi:MATH and LRR domain-containing protein PFE0570w-like [Bicyclus anynana]|uniref:MATH and LRR domain-containing protein PFE0570w-like n=1 Tax=Bicyclus anynana TaxID=110368 RepID=A0ABM3LVD2_BICAN|nr:MATH and LRR domain-containing protein PFE0570w-like [Bicyclus anynana]
MAVIIFKILTLTTIFALNTVKSDNTIVALKKILKELNDPVEDNSDANPKQYYHPRHHKHGKSKHNSSPNLMNVQTMNLILKPNKRQRDEIEVNRLLRTNSEESCEAGDERCGCTGSRCGSNRVDQLADEVDRFVNVINDQLSNDDEENDRNRAVVDDELGDRYRENERDRSMFRYVDNQGRDRDVSRKERVDREYDDIKIKYDRNDDDSDDFERDRYLDERENRYNNEDFLKSKRIKVNDNLDVVILDKSDLDALLGNQDFVDITRNRHMDDEDNEIFQRIVAQYKKFLNSEKHKLIEHGRSAVITPENFFELYESVKHQVTRKLKNYVKDKKLFTSLNMKYLTPNQKNKLRSLKMKYRRGEMEDATVDDEIVKIIFGNESKMKIVAHAEDNNHIFIPKWLYEKVLSSKKTLNEALRAHKRTRILPMTSQQKEKLFHKGTNNVVKPIGKLVWRKKLSQDIERYGIPFELEAHGLGQIAP